ncbi:hypothetical protein CHLNCDRAFT_137953 [Chlorella variabilis]|uniref:Alpha 1,4-glycosyltransferase domain-containing protein n=1 Tax=Chlorella variabilis TaxID=554065 RepID=E1Z4X6_CHLVA|nr:hypothetical protein CHLNCDRAFT_137953 [Chlorella variabilis]EFN59134.1 hypothetical protein CHLNCDRAFT_137953 [Chlorella variabilis]|eukprot:XP_005851236.1 hypothetical protein CHLNCDRAFT_137953 [Chlorella variabilis]
MFNPCDSWDRVAEIPEPGVGVAAFFNSSGARELAAGRFVRRRPGRQLRIPKLLHHVYLPDEHAFAEAAKAGKLRAEWPLSCRLMHPDFEHMLWDMRAAKTLIKRHYPELLPAFLGYNEVTRQSGAIRAAILHRFGGLYLDIDVSCLRPSTDMLAGADVVLQGAATSQPVSNGAMASVAGHRLWAQAMELMVERFLTDPKMPISNLTGPGLLQSALEEMGIAPIAKPGKAARPLSGLHKKDGGLVRIHPHGTFFSPCGWSAEGCHRKLALQLAVGTIPPNLVGYHRYLASWLPGGNPAGIFSQEDAAKKMAAGTSKTGAATAAANAPASSSSSSNSSSSSGSSN